MVEIAAAEGRDRPAVREIWLACFPDDTPETAEYFLKRLWAPGRCLVGRLDGRAVTMAFLLPAELVTASGVLPLRYVFAAATLPAYQGRGCFSSLLRHAHALAEAEGAAALFLRPAEPGLAAYYERFGYRPYFTAVEEDAAFGGRISPAEDGICPLTGDGQAAACRDAALEKRPVWVRWPAPVVGLSAYGADRFGGAGCYAMGGGEAPGALFFREWLASPKNEPAMLAAAAARYPGRRTFRRRRPAEPGEPAAPFGWLCPLTDRAERLLETAAQDLPYMGLALD